MILFVFEGETTEPLLFSTMKHLFLPKERNDIICTYKSNIYSLFNRMSANGYFDDSRTDVSLIPLLQEQLKQNGDINHPLLKITNWDEISEIFLFFDYDCQNKEKDKSYSLTENNKRIEKMLSFFNNETEAGKLYINYPMVESIRYTKKLPDLSFNTYTISLSDCPDAIFKKKVDTFSFYGSFDFLTLNFLTSLKVDMNLSNLTLKKQKLRSYWKQRKERKANWKLLIKQNIEKLFDINEIDKSEIKNKFSISQDMLFDIQQAKFVSKQMVSVICSIPLFLYDYIPLKRWY